VETPSASPVLRLENGVQMRLGRASRGQVFRNRFVLEKGGGQVSGSDRYSVEVRSLRIHAAEAAGVSSVALVKSGRVRVASVEGATEVTTSEGALLARLSRGEALEFEPQAAGARAPFLISGCVTVSGDHFMLTDQTARVTFELRGTDLADYAGQQVEVSAIDLRDVQPAPGASHVIQVSGIKRLGKSCRAPSSAGGGQAQGQGSGAKKAIIAGVAISGAAAGTVLGLTGDDSPSTVSR